MGGNITVGIIIGKADVTSEGKTPQGILRLRSLIFPENGTKTNREAIDVNALARAARK